MKQILLVSLFFLWFSGALKAQFANTLELKEGRTSPKASLDDVAWISGHWQGEALGGNVQEVWTSPIGDSMMGSFKLVSKKTGKTTFYELILIRAVEETITLQLKHFSNVLKGWEEKDETVDFKLVKVTPKKVFFDGMTFEQVSDQEMNVYVILKSKKGASEMKFNYKRVSKL